MSNTYRLRFLAVLLASTSTCAYAQTVATPIQLDEITANGQHKGNSATGPIDGYVAKQSATGTKTTTPLIETPQSITVVGAKQIRDLNEQTVDQALTYASGVRSAYFGADTRNDWFTIRGFPAQVNGYFLDGLQLYSTDFGTFKLEPFGLERIEVLKGPASVLYGGSNTGGIINAISKQPTDQFHGLLETGINTYGNAYAAFDLSGPVSAKSDNQFFYRVEGLAKGGGSQVDFTNDDRLFIAPTIAWRPDADTSVTIIGSYQKDDTKGANFLPYVGTVTPAPFGIIPTSLFTSDPGYDHFRRNQALIGYSLEHRFNDTFTVRQNVCYSDLKVASQTLFGGGYANGDPASGELVRFNFTEQPHVTEFAVDNQLETRFRTGPLAHTVLLGIDYKHYTIADTQDFVFGSNLNLLNPSYFTGTAPANSVFKNYLNKQDQLGEYLQDQAKLGRFTLVLSGRHDGLTSSFNDVLTPANSVSSSDGALTGRVGLIYTSDIGLAPYATYATSFSPQLGLNSASSKPLVPETGQLTEVGVKYQPVGAKFSVDAALFNLVQNNVLTTDPTDIVNTVQTGQERSRGFEIGANGQITEGLTILASYTGYRLRDTKDLNPALVGKVPTNIPQNFGALFLDYTIQSGELRGFGAGAGPRYVGGSYASNDNTLGVPNYVLADASVHFEREHWRAAVNVRNAFDKSYVASCQTVSACFYGERRVSTFSLAYRW